MLVVMIPIQVNMLSLPMGVIHAVALKSLVTAILWAFEKERRMYNKIYINTQKQIPGKIWIPK